MARSGRELITRVPSRKGYYDIYVVTHHILSREVIGIAGVD